MPTKISSVAFWVAFLYLTSDLFFSFFSTGIKSHVPETISPLSTGWGWDTTTTQHRYQTCKGIANQWQNKLHKTKMKAQRHISLYFCLPSFGLWQWGRSLLLAAPSCSHLSPQLEMWAALPDLRSAPGRTAHPAGPWISDPAHRVQINRCST